jgi:hypothetical protein
MVVNIKIKICSNLTPYGLLNRDYLSKLHGMSFQKIESITFKKITAHSDIYSAISLVTTDLWLQ